MEIHSQVMALRLFVREEDVPAFQEFLQSQCGEDGSPSGPFYVEVANRVATEVNAVLGEWELTHLLPQIESIHIIIKGD